MLLMTHASSCRWCPRSPRSRASRSCSSRPVPMAIRCAGGWFHNCALKKDQSIVCWGNNYAGAAEPPSGTFVALDVGSRQGCAIRTDKSLACWGGTNVAARTPPAGDDFTSVACGDESCCALHEDGSIACWGSIGAPPQGTFAELHLGIGNALARRANGTLTCWGRNDYGQCNLP